jgi:cyanophycin synthetase
MEPCNLISPDGGGRIPLIAIVGGRARDAGRCLAVLLRDAGYRVGRSSRDGVFLAGRKINLKPETTCGRARAVLRSSIIDVAVLELDSCELLPEGFSCDVMLLTGENEAEESNDLIAIPALDPQGKLVFNADDPPTEALAQPPSLSADRLICFARCRENEELCRHRAAGGIAVFLQADSLVVARGIEEQRLPFGGRPVQREAREQLALLAALAGAMALNLCGDEKPSRTAPEKAALEATLSAV